jgi:nitrite reductase/ring-hydroxylating ferredoxin subunit
VVAVQLPRPDRPDQFVPIFVVNDPVVGFLALHGRDPGSNCQMRWVPEVERIEDPCSGSKYTRTGEYLYGPSPRSLDRYPVTVSENGDIAVDLSGLQQGQPRP